MYLTASSLKDYLLCPFKFKLSHVEKLRKKTPKAILAFGTTVHAAIAKYFIERENPAETFKRIWILESETEYEFSNGESHETLLLQGEKMLSQWQSDPDTPVEASSIEKTRYIEVANRVPFWSTIDFTGEGGELLLDWKTSTTKYSEFKAKLDLQLTAYAYVLSVTEKFPSRVGFGVLIKKKTPEIQYCFSERTVEDFKNFEELVLKVFRDIEKEHFFKLPGMQCSWCDFLPVCMEEPDAESKFIITSDRYLSK